MALPTCKVSAWLPLALLQGCRTQKGTAPLSSSDETTDYPLSHKRALPIKDAGRGRADGWGSNGEVGIALLPGRVDQLQRKHPHPASFCWPQGRRRRPRGRPSLDVQTTSRTRTGRTASRTTGRCRTSEEYDIIRTASRPPSLRRLRGRDGRPRRRTASRSRRPSSRPVALGRTASSGRPQGRRPRDDFEDGTDGLQDDRTI